MPFSATVFPDVESTEKGEGEETDKMNARVLRWAVVGLMIISLLFLVSSPSLGEIVTLPLDQTVPGMPVPEENWTLVPGEEALSDARVLEYGTAQPKVLKYDAESGTWAPTDKDAAVSKFAWHFYEDPSISVRCEYATLLPAFKSKQIQSSVTYIKVANASQIRTAMSFDNYKKGGYVEAADMAAHKNAVAAVNGDFFKYHGKVGYVLRQGEFYRNKLNGKRDVLFIDQDGNFSVMYAASEADGDQYMASLPEGKTIVNTFTLGPVLAENGAARKISDTVVAKSGEFQWKYAQQRVAVVQTGELEYAIVEAYGKTDGSMGMTLQEFADYIVYLFPETIIAYNLDGGGSTNVVLKGARIHTTPGHRQISDILYFASAWQEE